MSRKSIWVIEHMVSKILTKLFQIKVAVFGATPSAADSALTEQASTMFLRWLMSSVQTSWHHTLVEKLCKMPLLISCPCGNVYNSNSRTATCSRCISHSRFLFEEQLLTSAQWAAMTMMTRVFGTCAPTGTSGGPGLGRRLMSTLFIASRIVCCVSTESRSPTTFKPRGLLPAHPFLGGASQWSTPAVSCQARCV